MKRPGDNNFGDQKNPKNICYSEEDPNILEDSLDEEGLVQPPINTSSALISPTPYQHPSLWRPWVTPQPPQPSQPSSHETPQTSRQQVFASTSNASSSLNQPPSPWRPWLFPSLNQSLSLWRPWTSSLPSSSAQSFHQPTQEDQATQEDQPSLNQPPSHPLSPQPLSNETPQSTDQHVQEDASIQRVSHPGTSALPDEVPRSVDYDVGDSDEESIQYPETAPFTPAFDFTHQVGGAVTTRSMTNFAQPLVPPTSTPPQLPASTPLQPSTSTPQKAPTSTPPQLQPPLLPQQPPQPQPQPSTDDNDWMNVPPGPSHWIPPSNDATPSNDADQRSSNPPDRPPRMVDTDGEESDEEDDGDQHDNLQNERRSRQLDTYLFEYDSSPPKIFKRQSAKSFKAKPINGTSNYENEVENFHTQLTPFLERERRAHYPRGMKVHIGAKVTFLVIKNGVVVDTPSFLYTTKSCTILRDDDVHEVMGPTMSRLIEQIADQQERGSGFVFQ